jgi:hypothetical protein
MDSFRGGFRGQNSELVSLHGLGHSLMVLNSCCKHFLTQRAPQGARSGPLLQMKCSTLQPCQTIQQQVKWTYHGQFRLNQFHHPT